MKRSAYLKITDWGPSERNTAGYRSGNGVRGVQHQQPHTERSRNHQSSAHIGSRPKDHLRWSSYISRDGVRGGGPVHRRSSQLGTTPIHSRIVVPRHHTSDSREGATAALTMDIIKPKDSSQNKDHPKLFMEIIKIPAPSKTLKPEPQSKIEIVKPLRDHSEEEAVLISRADLSKKNLLLESCQRIMLLALENKRLSTSRSEDAGLIS